ncbi:trypsin-like serine peptidase [Aquipseudomonas ullengensis]|uniref:trypsin-like serine peptidase n=1 Tax=Aquipseudomonas ullengensis TaxID=2759166 RepID=UPI001F256488|nr:serine protease [Pseudomonas ullengensis]
MSLIEPLLLSSSHISTYAGTQQLTNASSFFFQRDERLFVVTSRHVLFDEANNHRPDSVSVVVHNNPANMASSICYSLPLYCNGQPLWRQGGDSAGDVDVAVLEVDRTQLPPDVLLIPFTPAHLTQHFDQIEVGTPLLVVGFPLGFHDTLHHMPVVRQAVIASSFGLRFQGLGFFLTDARTHRGSSGGAVVTHRPELGELPWLLLGVHSARLDLACRDLAQDEALGLNSAWYADILMTLTEN